MRTCRQETIILTRVHLAQNRRPPDILLLSFVVDPEDYQPPIWKSYCKYSFNIIHADIILMSQLDPVDRLDTNNQNKTHSTEEIQ